MNVDVNDIGHAVRIMSGFESYMDNVDNKDRIYAKTCLRLNGLDLNKVSGNEGFMDNIKAGGKKMIEMIMNLLRQIRDVFFGPAGSKKDKEIKDAVAATAKASTEIKQNFTLVSKYSNPAMDKAMEDLKAGAARLEKLMSGETFGINTEKWGKALSDFRKDLWDASTQASYVERIPQVKITDMTFGSGKLMEAIRKLQEGLRDGNGDTENVRIIETAADAADISDLIEKVRDVAKEILAGVTVDLDVNTKGYKKLLEHDDETLQGRARAMQDLCTKMTKVSQGMTTLISQCNNEILVLFNGVEKLNAVINKAK